MTVDCGGSFRTENGTPRKGTTQHPATKLYFFTRWLANRECIASMTL